MYNDTVVTLCSLYVELILQQKASGGHRISEAEKNLDSVTKNGKIITTPCLSYLCIPDH